MCAGPRLLKIKRQRFSTFTLLLISRSYWFDKSQFVKRGKTATSCNSAFAWGTTQLFPIHHQGLWDFIGVGGGRGGAQGAGAGPTHASWWGRGRGASVAPGWPPMLAHIMPRICKMTIHRKRVLRIPLTKYLLVKRRRKNNKRLPLHLKFSCKNNAVSVIW